MPRVQPSKVKRQKKTKNKQTNKQTKPGKGQKKTHLNQKKAGMAVLISDKVVFRAKKIARDGEGHYITIKGSKHQKDIVIPNAYLLNNEL